MKTRLIGLLFALVFAFGLTANTYGDTIKDGTIVYKTGFLAGQPIPLGVDSYGYNYQAHMFSGSYFNSYANAAGFAPYTGDDVTYLGANPGAANHWAWPYRNDQLAMKWNDEWTSNKDLNGDFYLDKPVDVQAIGSGAWLTNHQSGKYVDDDGLEQVWNYFVKIVAVPADATLSGGVWMSAAGKEIGPAIWATGSGPFAVTLEIYNDSGTGDHGVWSRGDCPGLGQF